MPPKDAARSTTTRSGASPFAIFGQERTEAAAALQKELLETYEEASRAWLARMQAEVAMWSELATELTATRSVPEALAAYSKSVSQRMQMAADDGKRLFDNCQQITQKIAKSFGNGHPTATT